MSKNTQDLGFAEADPTADVEGFDAADKAAILAGLAFHSRVTDKDVYREGISKITATDVKVAKAMEMVIKLLAITELTAAGEISATSLNVNLYAASDFQGGKTEGSEHRKILTGILAAANLIANRGRRGAGNFAVVGPQVATALQSVAGYVPNPFANTVSQAAGAIYPVGSVAGVQVYTNPKWKWNNFDVLVGRKGDGNGPGLVFMPYLMAESVQTIAEATMAPKIAVKSRFALVEAGFHPETQYVKFTIGQVAGAAHTWSNLISLA